MKFLFILYAVYASNDVLVLGAKLLSFCLAVSWDTNTNGAYI